MGMEDMLVMWPGRLKLENVFMKHYAPNHMLASKEGLSPNV